LAGPNEKRDYKRAQKPLYSILILLYRICAYLLRTSGGLRLERLEQRLGLAYPRDQLVLERVDIRYVPRVSQEGLTRRGSILVIDKESEVETRNLARRARPAA
jgi:hypothetical protein